MSKRRAAPETDNLGPCAACGVLPATPESIMCHGCENSARRLVGQYMAAQELQPDVLVRSPAGSGSPGRELP